jgi:hypothetical protein
MFSGTFSPVLEWEHNVLKDVRGGGRERGSEIWDGAERP